MTDSTTQVRSRTVKQAGRNFFMYLCPVWSSIVTPTSWMLVAFAQGCVLELDGRESISSSSMS